MGISTLAAVSQIGTASQQAALNVSLPPPAQNRAMADHPTHVELDAKLAAAEARSDVKFAQLIGKIETSNAELKGEFKAVATRLEGLEKSTSGVKATIIGAALGTIAIVIGILTFGQQWFGIGMTARDIVRSTVIEMQQTAPSPAPKP
jgi:hypothetical protein